MKKLIILIVLTFFISSIASAEIIRGIDMDFVTIGNAGNPGDTRTDYPDSSDPYNCGAVDYSYQIGEYEVTNSQWNTFVSIAGAPTGNPESAFDQTAIWTGNNIPANKVSWYEVTQFCNYLTSGDKSQGAYQWSGDNTNPGDFLGIDRTFAVSVYETVYVLPTEDEWYKAAYYTGSGYSTYANGTDVAPIAGFDTNYDMAIGQPWDVGVGNGTREQNGTFDMMGNLYEWNETHLYTAARGTRGGGFDNIDRFLKTSYRGATGPSIEFSIGFRVASVVPEPGTVLLFGLGGLFLRKRSA